MNRRRFLRRAAGGGAMAWLPSRARSQQDTAAAPADPLPWPGVAGATRAEVDSMDNSVVVKAIELRLRCNCGCGLNIYTCRTTDFTCSVSPALHREVVALLETGRTPDQVMEDFVAKYGESILMAPKARGFGMVGYALPGGVVLLAGSLLAAVLLRRSRAARGTPEPAPVPGPSVRPGSDSASPEEMDRLEQALREFDA